VRQVGGTIGVAVLGTVLATVYRGRLHLTGLPAAAEHVIRGSVAGGVAAARAASSPQLIDIVRSAYVHGLDVMLWMCSGIAIASALLALAFLPGRGAEDAQAAPPASGEGDTTSGGAGPTTSLLDKSRMST
jgi:hypothetical protein